MSSPTITLELLRSGTIDQFSANAVVFDSEVASREAARATRFHAEEEIHRGRSHVQKGKLKCDGLETQINAICKFTVTHVPELYDEAELYSTKLRELQGQDIPVCYGYFECLYRDYNGRRRTMGCLILEDCGDSLNWDLDDIPEEIQYVSIC